MYTYRRSFSCSNLHSSKLNIIENLLDQNVPTLKPSKTSIFKVSYAKVNRIFWKRRTCNKLRSNSRWSYLIFRLHLFVHRKMKKQNYPMMRASTSQAWTMTMLIIIRISIHRYGCAHASMKWLSRSAELFPDAYQAGSKARFCATDQDALKSASIDSITCSTVLLYYTGEVFTLILCLQICL